jgi:hypothetical protein
MEDIFGLKKPQREYSKDDSKENQKIDFDDLVEC